MLEYHCKEDVEVLTKEYPTYEEREKYKSEGWSNMAKCQSPRQKAFLYLHMIIWAHYWRAREGIEAQRNCQTLIKKIRGKKYYPSYVLDMDHYIPHWLHSMKHKIPQDVLDVLKEDWSYEPEENKHLPEGFTIYQFQA